MEPTQTLAADKPRWWQDTARPREGLWLGLVLALLTALPFLFAVRPQQADFAAHLARYHVMLNAADSPYLTRFYEFAWIVNGNLGVDLLMVPLGTLLGVDRAAWLIALLLPVLTGLATICVEWTLRRRVGPGALLAFTLIWSPAMLMGFANFTLSLALALFAFALWVRLEGWRWRAPLFVLIGLAVWLCHSAGWGVLGVMVFGYEWHRQKSPRALIGPWPLFFPFVAMVLTAAKAGSIDYDGSGPAYKLTIWFSALDAHRLPLDILSVIVLIGIIVAALRARKLDGRLAWGALLVAVLTLALPRHFGGGDLADLRLVPVALLLGCLAIDLRVPRWVLYAAPALFLVRLAITAHAWKEDSTKLEQALAAMDHIPAGARVAGAVAWTPGLWGADALAHAPSYATVYRDALVNSHFAIDGIHMLRLRDGLDGFSDPSQRIEVAPDGSVDLTRFPPAAQADYLWYIGAEPVTKVPAGAKVLHRSTSSLLLQLAKPD